MTVPATTVPVNGYVGPVVRFGPRRRMLYVELPADAMTAPAIGVPGSAPSRSGASLGRPRQPLYLSEPIRALASTLKGRTGGASQTFLEVNGLSVRGVFEEPAEGVSEGPVSIPRQADVPERSLSKPT